ncbi:hypothetical protein [Pelomonas aquatica]|jgi:hypothetical protein|uniref:Secreted protein n=1 Tax=Pelomonas aquatica TaxID=431058 RepID=A0A9X4R8J1_9BURK|nr:hypothetical protein [Pelomonas aquatica]MCY4753548.1 hypothetical protein [Pelomonas aquatica]MDG0863308.1 hypothetical protein [Pelomonas aquatica]
MKRSLLLLSPLLLAACASAPTDPKQDVAAAPIDKDTICERETRTGTLMPTLRCRTAAQREADKRDAEAVSDAVRRGAPTPAPKNGS